MVNDMRCFHPGYRLLLLLVPLLLSGCIQSASEDPYIHQWLRDKLSEQVESLRSIKEVTPLSEADKELVLKAEYLYAQSQQLLEAIDQGIEPQQGQEQYEALLAISPGPTGDALPLDDKEAAKNRVLTATIDRMENLLRQIGSDSPSFSELSYQFTPGEGHNPSRGIYKGELQVTARTKGDDNVRYEINGVPLSKSGAKAIVDMEDKSGKKPVVSVLLPNGVIVEGELE